MDVLSTEEHQAVHACGSEYLKSAQEVSEDLLTRITGALKAHALFFQRADISWEISLPIHRPKSSALTRRDGKIYSGDHLLYDPASLDAHSHAFIAGILEKNQIAIEDSGHH